MVKAIKRKPGFDGKALKKGMSKDKKLQIMILIVLALLVLGWSVGSYLGTTQSAGEPAQQTGQENNGYNVGVRTGSEDSKIVNVTGYSAVFGQLTSELDTKRRLNGELYHLDNGYSQLVLTNASADAITQWAKGEFIVYKVAVCSDFDCLVDDKMAANLTASFSFDLYSLNATSKFLQTRTIGLPSAKEAIVL